MKNRIDLIRQIVQDKKKEDERVERMAHHLQLSEKNRSEGESYQLFGNGQFVPTQYDVDEELRNLSRNKLENFLTPEE
jgi:hypothetical protein